MVWADAAGRPTGPPLQAQQVRGQAVLAAALAPVVLMLLCAGQLAHHLLGRRRLATWDAEWRVISPQWTRQRWAGAVGDVAADLAGERPVLWVGGHPRPAPG